MTTLRSLLRLKNGSDRLSITEQLKRDNLPVVMWGAGNVAHSVKAILDRSSIPLAGIWVDSPPPSTNKCLDGIPISTYEQITAKFSTFNVVCGHSRYDLAPDTEKAHSEINRIYCFANVVYGQFDSIPSEFIEAHLQEYEASYELFEDDLSRQCFAAYLNSRNNDDCSFILPCCENEYSKSQGIGRKYFTNPFFSVGADDVYLDVGAYNGDTVREFVEAAGGKYRKILAMEPEPGNFALLKKYVKDSGLHDVEIFRNGCGDKNGTAYLDLGLFSENSSIGSEDDGGEKITVRRIDEQFASEEITLIKIALRTNVAETLRGAEKILQARKPNIVMPIGVLDDTGLIDIPQTIKQLNPNIRLSLRYAAPIPARLLLFGY